RGCGFRRMAADARGHYRDTSALLWLVLAPWAGLSGMMHVSWPADGVRGARSGTLCPREGERDHDGAAIASAQSTRRIIEVWRHCTSAKLNLRGTFTQFWSRSGRVARWLSNRIAGQWPF